MAKSQRPGLHASDPSGPCRTRPDRRAVDRLRDQRAQSLGLTLPQRQETNSPPTTRGVVWTPTNKQYEQIADSPPLVQVRELLAIRCSPDRIRTGATALRGRRPRPLDDGARRLAGVPGLEPRLTGPEPVGLPITPHPTGPSGPQPSGPGWMPDRLAALGLAHDSG